MERSEPRTFDVPITASGERRKWSVVAACVVAGALSVRPDSLGTALAAAGAGLVAWLALRVWEWSRLPSFMRGRTEQDHAWRMLQPLRWLTLGLVVGLLLLAVIRLAIEPVLPAIGTRIAMAGALPVWRRLVIIFVAAVLEELVFRLLLLSAIVGLVLRLRRQTSLVPTAGTVWTANTLAAFAFAAVHLSSWSVAAPDTGNVAMAVLTLNGIAGLVIGYVFATRGIAAAMWTHAGGDWAIQLLGPLAL